MRKTLLAAAGATLLAVVTAWALVAGEPQAGAVQTADLGLVAAPGPHGSFRPVIVDRADGGTYRDAVLVYNRSDRRLRVDLRALAVVRSADGAFQLGTAGARPAPVVTLAASELVLAPHREARVPLTIATPHVSRGTTYAAVTAIAGSTRAGALDVEQQLAVLIRLEPSRTGVAEGGVPWWPFLLAGGAVVVLFVLLLLVLFARRRDDEEREHGGGRVGGGGRHRRALGRAGAHRRGRRPVERDPRPCGEPAPALAIDEEFRSGGPGRGWR